MKNEKQKRKKKKHKNTKTAKQKNTKTQKQPPGCRQLMSPGCSLPPPLFHPRVRPLQNGDADDGRATQVYRGGCRVSGGRGSEQPIGSTEWKTKEHNKYRTKDKRQKTKNKRHKTNNEKNEPKLFARYAHTHPPPSMETRHAPTLIL